MKIGLLVSILISLFIITGSTHSIRAAATDCTLYVSPTGNDNNNGTSTTTPKTLNGASKATVPGSVVCLLSGTYNLTTTFYPANSGTANAYIVYKSYDGQAQLFWQGPGSGGDTNVINLYQNKNYIEINGLSINANNNVNNGISCQSSHHIRVIGNTITNAGGAGIATVLCDYVTADRNNIYHNGYVTGWSSGISLNSNQWTDQYQGFHSYVVNNIISGTVDQKGDPSSGKITDGNGIILDLSNRSYDSSSPNTPPVLVANNVIYQNGGRCLIAFLVTNGWFVNNTCYKNTLDLRMGDQTSFSYVGEITSNQVLQSYFINNIAYAWTPSSKTRQPYQWIDNKAFSNYPNDNVRYFKNIYFGGGGNYLPTSISNDVNQVFKSDPLFINPPLVDSSSDGQYKNAIQPSQIGTRLQLQLQSSAINAGIDPLAITPEIMTSSRQIVQSLALRSDLKKYILTDILGVQRPQGSSYDIGAYESTNTSTPTVAGSPTSNPRPGDANGDNKVDGVDYLTWLNHYNQNTTNGQRDGDFNNSGKVDGADYIIWLTNYGK